tara:strand:- start:684 stop:1379 length:696 start_codon:yes stop_codon:yes gene_type:complete
MSRKNILLYGSKSTAFIIYEMLKEVKKTPKYMFDPLSAKPFFKSDLIFSNKVKDLKMFVKKSKYFSVCIAREDGFARYSVSKKLEKLGLKPLTIKSKLSHIHKNSIIGNGLISMAKSYINRSVKMGDYCIINTAAVVDHECEIGNGVHLMGGCYLAGRVKIGNFSSVGATATILPDIKIGNFSIIGAGAVVTKNVPDNTVVVGNPAKFLRNNHPKRDLKVFDAFKDEKKKN